jgi:hypothetical protein
MPIEWYKIPRYGQIFIRNSKFDKNSTYSARKISIPDLVDILNRRYPLKRILLIIDVLSAFFFDELELAATTGPPHTVVFCSGSLIIFYKLWHKALQREYCFHLTS